MGTKKGVKEFVFAIITGFLGRTEINFFEVGFQKPRWSLSRTSITSFYLKHIGSGVSGK